MSPRQCRSSKRFTLPIVPYLPAAPTNGLLRPPVRTGPTGHDMSVDPHRVPCMGLEWNKLIVDQLEFYWDVHLRPRLDGLTDDEYFWEPVADAWNVRRAED